MAASTSFLLQPAGLRGSQESSQLACQYWSITDVPLHPCSPPHHAKAHPLSQLSTMFTPRGEDETSYLTDRALKHLINASNLRLIAGNPLRQVLQKTFVLNRRAPHGSALCRHHPQRGSIYPPPTASTPGVSPRGIPHLPLTNLPVPGQGDTA